VKKRTSQSRGKGGKQRGRARSTWIAVGALVASTAVGGRGAIAAEPGSDLASPGRRPLSLLPARRSIELILSDLPHSARLQALRLIVPSETLGWQSAGAQQRDQDPPVRRFDIPPGPLSVALDAFRAATGVTVRLAQEGLGELPSPGVAGVFTAEQALQQLLSGTGVSYRFVSPDAVSLELQAAAEFVEVTAGAATLSSPKFTEPLRDVPQTINVIPRTVMEQQGATTLRDALRNVPGITFQAGEGGVPAGDQLTIRGFSARTDMFIDGVRDFGGYTRDAFNLEQVEVSKGPASSIAGRGSTGGAINQVSKAPFLDTSYTGTIGAGNAEYGRGTLDINQPLGPLGLEHAAIRLNAMWNDSDVPGRDQVHSRRWGFAPSLALGVATPTRVTASYFHLAQDGLPEYGLPWVPANTNPELAAYSNGIPPVDQSNFYGLTTRDYEDTVTHLGTLQVERDFSSAFTLRNLTRLGETTRDSVITSPRFASVNTSTALNRQLQSRDMNDGIVTNQTNLTLRGRTAGLEHAVTGGVEFTKETSENWLRSGPAAAQADLYDPDPFVPYPGPITRTGARNTGEANTLGAYAFDTVSIGQRWEVSGGLRWDRFDVDYESVPATGDTLALGRTDDVVSGRAGVVFKPRPNGSIYAGYGTAFNPSAEGLSLTAATVLLEPEKSRNIEVGTKWDVYRQRLSLTAALFRAEKTNARTPGLNPGDPPTVLQGRQTVDGVEFGANGRVNDRWSIYGGYSFMHSEIAASNTPAEIDNALALTPEQTFNIWTTYEFPWRLTIGGGAQYMDSVFRNATNTATVPSYWLLNTLVSYDVNQHLTLRLNGNNLADETYVDRVGGGHYIPGSGRSLQLSASVRF
jgi:catecholate siderophore receptor